MDEHNNEHIQELIDNIATKNRTIMTKDDPIMVLFTLYEYILKQSEKQQIQTHLQLNQANQETLERLNHAFELNQKSWNTQIDQKASRFINVALEQTQAQIKTEKAAFFAELRKHHLATQTSIKFTEKLLVLGMLGAAFAMGMCVMLLFPHF